MPASPKNKRKKKNICLRLQNTGKPDLNNQRSVCEENTCSQKPVTSSDTSTQSILAKFQGQQKKFLNTSKECAPEEKPLSSVYTLEPLFDYFTPEFLLDYFPSEFRSHIKMAIHKGIFFSFLATLTEDIVTDIMKKLHYSSQQIALTNQTIKSILLILTGLSLGKSVAAPIMNFILIKGFGAKKEVANKLSLATLVATDLLTNPLTVAKAVTVSGIAAVSLVTSTATHFSYTKAKQLISAGKETFNQARDTIQSLAYNVYRAH